MTFSIVAIDKKNKEVGFAIASCAWNAGLVCRAEPEVGVIASQAQGNIVFLKEFFEQLEKKKSLEEIMHHFKEIDEKIEHRQIGMVTFKGDSFSFTGEKNAYWAGHKTGKDYACQGNILVGSEVIEQMSSAFEKTDGSLTERLYAALKAADEAGGDSRGKQSARLLVKKIGARKDISDVLIDITIEDHAEPVKEVGRILDVRNNLNRLYAFYGELHKTENKE